VSNISNADDFNRQIDAFEKAEQEQAVADFQRGLAVEALGRIVDRTPVLDGPLRGSWQIDIGAPVGGDGSTPDSNGTATKERGRATVAALLPYARAFIATAMPQAPVIEEGRYPNPVKRGTRIRQKYLRTRRRKRIARGDLPVGTDPNYEIRSAGGFSKQAPEGIVAPVARELANYLET
jgi:hypothetical protein